MSRKSFRDNPALQFVSKVESERNVETREVKDIVNSSKKIENIFARDLGSHEKNSKYMSKVFETKSKRFNMLIRPSVFAHLKKDAEIKGTSVNDLMHKIFETYIENDN